MNNSAKSRRFPPSAGRAARRPAKSVLFLLLAAVCLLVAASFYWLSKKNSANRREETALSTQDAPPPINESPAVATSNTRPSDDDEAATPVQASETTQALKGAYRVLPARAYFYSAPRQNSSTAKYVLRDDIIYAEGESGDFIQTRFYNASGDPVTGWLRKTDVQSAKANTASTTPARPTPTPSRPAPAPRVTTTPTETKADPPASPQNTPPSTTQTAATTGVVRVDTTYFFDSPDLTQRRRAFCIRGDKVKIGESSENAVFVTFVNWEKVTTKGWIRKEDLTIR
ncbi:hypothetical protein ACW9KT_12385 [Hymenobacter sp. HD11105]